MPDTDATRMERLVDMEDGLRLVELCGENPIIACAEETSESCAYKREYEMRLEKYNIERLMRWPECEACECSLVVIRDD